MIGFILHILISCLRQLLFKTRRSKFGIKPLDDVLRGHLDLSINITHGEITLDKNPKELQRDHIFPGLKHEKAASSCEMVNHYANFHFLRINDSGAILDENSTSLHKALDNLHSQRSNK